MDDEAFDRYVADELMEASVGAPPDFASPRRPEDTSPRWIGVTMLGVLVVAFGGWFTIANWGGQNEISATAGLQEVEPSSDVDGGPKAPIGDDVGSSPTTLDIKGVDPEDTVESSLTKLETDEEITSYAVATARLFGYADEELIRRDGVSYGVVEDGKIVASSFSNLPLGVEWDGALVIAVSASEGSFTAPRGPVSDIPIAGDTLVILRAASGDETRTVVAERSIQPVLQAVTSK